MHGPGHSSEDCKFLQECIEKRLAQHTYKEKQALSGGNKRIKTVNCEGASEEANVMKSHDEPIQRKETKRMENNKPKSDQANAYQQ